VGQLDEIRREAMSDAPCPFVSLPPVRSVSSQRWVARAPWWPDAPRRVDSLARPAPIPVRIAADGTFSGQIQYGTDSTSRWAQMIVVWAMVRGRINGTALEATVTDHRCTRDLTLQQR
jgi:hypothetical protein